MCVGVGGGVGGGRECVWTLWILYTLWFYTVDTDVEHLAEMGCSSQLLQETFCCQVQHCLVPLSLSSSFPSCLCWCVRLPLSLSKHYIVLSKCFLAF